MAGRFRGGGRYSLKSVDDRRQFLGESMSAHFALLNLEEGRPLREALTLVLREPPERWRVRLEPRPECLRIFNRRCQGSSLQNLAPLDLARDKRLEILLESRKRPRLRAERDEID
jgi:hypothetical protein